MSLFGFFFLKPEMTPCLFFKQFWTSYHHHYDGDDDNEITPQNPGPRQLPP